MYTQMYVNSLEKKQRLFSFDGNADATTETIIAESSKEISYLTYCGQIICVCLRMYECMYCWQAVLILLLDLRNSFCSHRCTEHSLIQICLITSS